MKTKKDMLYSFNHTKERLEDRYGIEINAVDYTEMCETIIHKKIGINVLYISSEKQKNDVQEIYDMYLKSKLVRVVWSTTDKCIKTALPMSG